jgi:hypothetical protein
LCFTAGVALLVGCSDRLETGYRPQRLGDSDTQRRAYYAAPFSPESQVPDEAKAERLHRRPTSAN